MKVAEAVDRRFLSRAVRDAAAMRFLLNAYAEAEAEEQVLVFERVRPYLPKKLHPLLDRHAADEQKHHDWFAAQLERYGGRREPLPEALRLAPIIDRVAGYEITQDVHDAESAALAYLVLWALERRLVYRFQLLADVMRPVDAECADVLDRIVADERKHVGFCLAVAERLVPDPDRRRSLEQRATRVEEAAFGQVTLRILDHMLRYTLETMSRPERMAWRAFVLAGKLSPVTRMPIPAH